MFKITPIQDTSLAKKYIEACGANFRDLCFVYAMTDCDTDELMGVAQFELVGEYGYIFDLKEPEGSDDFEAMFILGRQTMNFINSCGLDICRASLDAGNSELIKAIGFKCYENFYECNTDGMFDGSHCSGHNKK